MLRCLHPTEGRRKKAGLLVSHLCPDQDSCTVWACFMPKLRQALGVELRFPALDVVFTHIGAMHAAVCALINLRNVLAASGLSLTDSVCFSKQMGPTARLWSPQCRCCCVFRHLLRSIPYRGHQTSKICSTVSHFESFVDIVPTFGEV